MKTGTRPSLRPLVAWRNAAMSYGAWRERQPYRRRYTCHYQPDAAPHPPPPPAPHFLLFLRLLLLPFLLLSLAAASFLLHLMWLTHKTPKRKRSWCLVFFVRLPQSMAALSPPSLLSFFSSTFIILLASNFFSLSLSHFLPFQYSLKWCVISFIHCSYFKLLFLLVFIFLTFPASCKLGSFTGMSPVYIFLHYYLV